MKTTVAFVLFLAFLTTPALAADWQPATAAASRPLLGRPQALGSCTPAPQPRIQQPRAIVRGKLDMHMATAESTLGLLPVLQSEPPEIAPPAAEPLPLMPQLASPVKVEPLPMPKGPAVPSSPLSATVDCDCGACSNLCDCCCQCDCCCNNCCCCSCCNMCCNVCCIPRPLTWIGADYLLWNFSRQFVPPLVTTSSQADNGVLGQPSTRVLYGSDQLNSDRWHSGARVGGGYWFSSTSCWGVDASGFIVGRDTNSRTFASNGDPLLARPFTDVNNGPSANIVATTNLMGMPQQPVSGAVTVRSETLLWGFDADLRRKWLSNGCSHLDLLIGYRQVRLDESIEIDDIEVGGVDLINRNVFDRFHTRNIFTGGQIGFDGRFLLSPRWSLSSVFKIAFGSMQQTVAINGFTEFSGGAPPIQPATQPGGLLALNSNIGTHQRQRFAVVPEVQLKLLYQINNNWSAFAGYNLLILSSVVRPGEQIDFTIDPTQIPGMNNQGGPGTKPAVLFNTSSFVAQGVNFGLLCEY